VFLGLATTEKQNTTTLSSVERELDEVFPDIAESVRGTATVVIRLREYDFYERVAVFRETTKRQSVTVAVEQSGPIGTRSVVADKTYAWDKGNGPRNGWQFQLRCAIESVGQDLREKYGTVPDFKNAVSEVIDDE